MKVVARVIFLDETSCTKSSTSSIPCLCCQLSILGCSYFLNHVRFFKWPHKMGSRSQKFYFIHPMFLNHVYTGSFTMMQETGCPRVIARITNLNI